VHWLVETEKWSIAVTGKTALPGSYGCGGHGTIQVLGGSHEENSKNKPNNTGSRKKRNVIPRTRRKSRKKRKP